MDDELYKYEQLANPRPNKPIKSKAASVSNTLSELNHKLKRLREELANSSKGASSESLQEIFKTTLADFEASKAQIDDRLKETHASGIKIGKLIDKVRRIPSSVTSQHLQFTLRVQKTSTALPEYPALFQGNEAASALRRVVAQHLIRNGAIKVAHTFVEVRKWSNTYIPEPLCLTITFRNLDWKYQKQSIQHLQNFVPYLML
jgi:hypothetical protein